ncbi:MAG: tail fiber protein [Alphaproteobacteria bacterium]|nr:tail fiber protein [Alphaproteobacteria bacterium]
MEPFIGEIKYVAFSYVPRGYALCNGAVMTVSQNQALYALIGSTFGAPNAQSFNLPDLRGRTVVGAAVAANAPQPPYKIGDKAGSDGVALTLAQIPAHTHALMGLDVTATKAVPTNSMFANSVPQPNAAPNPPYGTAPTDNTKVVALAPASIGMMGQSAPHPNIQPSLAVQAVIALAGVFPPRT